MFTHKILLITAGTGSFGNGVLKSFLDSELREVRIFSRDEKKQDDTRIYKSYSNIFLYKEVLRCCTITE